MPGSMKKVTADHISEELYERIRRVAEREDRSVAAIVRLAVTDYVEQAEKVMAEADALVNQEVA